MGFDIKNVRSDSDIDAFIESASGDRSDTRLDRILEVFNSMRQAAPVGAWHHIPGARSFTKDYGRENPFIPAAIREHEIRTRHQVGGVDEFLRSWDEAKYTKVAEEIDVEALFATINSESSIASTFAKNNLHDTDYFFTKYAEWHTTITVARRRSAKVILDLGAAYNGFAKCAAASNPNIEIIMSDLIFEPGVREVLPRIFQHGGDAGALDGVEDSSIDIACAHNAFEHFSGDADSRCMSAIERVLRPGGVALITPFLAGNLHTITVNPFSCFTASSNSHEMEVRIAEEIESENASLSYNFGMVSDFTRAYSFKSFQSRLLSHAPRLKPSLRIVDFSPNGFDEQGASMHDCYQMKVERDVFTRKRFWMLVLEKV